jgi:hypothetical protein
MQQWHCSAAVAPAGECTVMHRLYAVAHDTVPGVPHHAAAMALFFLPLLVLVLLLLLL